MRSLSPTNTIMEPERSYYSKLKPEEHNLVGAIVCALVALVAMIYLIINALS